MKRPRPSALRRWLARTPPPAVLAVGYLTLIAVGGLLLMLPPMTHTPITLSDALFTSTSAVTVTFASLSASVVTASPSTWRTAGSSMVSPISAC